MHMKETEHLEEERGSPMSTEMASPPRQPKPEPMQCFTSVMRNTVKGMENNITLWQFLLELLLSHQHNDKIQWTNNEGEFKLINAEEVAKLWGMRKNKANMNYDKLSRALRYYYDKNIIKKVMGQKFVYKFVSFPEVVKTENKIPFKVKMESLSQGFGVRSTPCVSSFKPYEPKYSSPSSQSSHAHSAVIAADSPASVESHWAQTGQTIAHTIPLHSVPMHADTVFALPHSQPLPVKLENVKMEHPPQHSTPSPVPPVEIRVCDSPVSVRSRSVSPAPPSHRGSPAPARESPAPHRVSPAPPRTSPAPSRTSPAPERYSPAPQRYSPAPQRYSPGPSRYSPGPSRYSPGPSRYSPGPQRYSPPSQRYSPAPQRYAPATHRVSPAPSSSRANPGISVSPAPPVSESEQTVNVSPSGSGGRPKPYPLSLEPSVLSPMPIPSPKVPLESLTAASFSQFTGRLPGSLSAMPTPTIFLASPVVGGGAQRTPMMPLHFWSSLSPLATLSPRLSATSAQHFQFPSLSGADGRYSLSPAINVPHFTGFNDLQSPVFVTSPTKKNIPVP